MRKEQDILHALFVEDEGQNQGKVRMFDRMSDERVEILYRAGELEKFRKDILAGNLCDIFLPASFIEADNAVGAVYDTSGYMRYPDMHDIAASTLIGIVTSILDKTGQADRRYFFTGEYSLDKRLIYVHKKIPDARLIYRRTAPFGKNEMLEKFKEILTPEGENNTVKGWDYIRRALFILGDSRKSYALIRHDLMTLEAEAFRAEC